MAQLEIGFTSWIQYGLQMDLVTVKNPRTVETYTRHVTANEKCADIVKHYQK